jgi:acetolactate synthase-1/2/3 large subunit
VVITGQVATHLISNDAFRNATRKITAPATQLARARREGSPRVLPEAFVIARPAARAGGCRYSQRCAVQENQICGPSQIRHRTYRPRLDPDMDAIRSAMRMMAAAKRPVFCYRRRHHQFGRKELALRG